MRLVRLEVENFRGVRSAKLDFEPGFNVLHGPNELGKSTLAEAVRAALLMPKSKQAESYLRWDGAVPTRVALTCCTRRPRSDAARAWSSSMTASPTTER